MSTERSPSGSRENASTFCRFSQLAHRASTPSTRWSPRVQRTISNEVLWLRRRTMGSHQRFGRHRKQVHVTIGLDIQDGEPFHGSIVDAARLIDRERLAWTQPFSLDRLFPPAW